MICKIKNNSFRQIQFTGDNIEEVQKILKRTHKVEQHLNYLKITNKETNRIMFVYINEHILSNKSFIIILSDNEFNKHIYHIKVTDNRNIYKETIQEITGITFDELKSRKKTQELVFARKIYSHICRLDKFTMKQIAKDLNRNHSSIVKQEEKFDTDYQYCFEFRKLYNKIKEAIDVKLTQKQENEIQ